MGILARMSKILRANTNDLLDRSEKPEAMLNEIIRDMEATLKQADLDSAEQLSQQRSIQSRLDYAKQLANPPRLNAGPTPSPQADDLAGQRQVALYETLLEAQTRAVEVITSTRDGLRQKYEDTLRNRDALIVRAKRAQAQAPMTQPAARRSTMRQRIGFDRRATE